MCLFWKFQQISVGILKALTDSNKQNEEEMKKKIKGKTYVPDIVII